MKKNLNAVIMFFFFIILSLNGLFLQKSEAKMDAYEFYQKYKSLMILGTCDEEKIKTLNSLSDTELNELIKIVQDKEFRDGLRDYVMGEDALNNPLKNLEFYKEEKARVKKYNNLYNKVNAIELDEFSEDNIEYLQNIKKQATKSDNDNEVTYDGHYYTNVMKNLGVILGNQYNIDKNLNEDNNPTEILKKYIQARIDIIETHRLDMEEVNGSISGVIDPDYYNPISGSISNDSEDALVIKTKVGFILGAIRNISIIVAVISLMVIGVKYILGSVEEKAEYKKNLIPYVIGIIMVVLSTEIVSFIYNGIIN